MLAVEDLLKEMNMPPSEDKQREIENDVCKPEGEAVLSSAKINGERKISKEVTRVLLVYCLFLTLLFFMFDQWLIPFFAFISFFAFVFVSLCISSWVWRSFALFIMLLFLHVISCNFHHPDGARIAVVGEDMLNIAIALEAFRVYEGRLPTMREYYDATKSNDGFPSTIPPVAKTLTSPVEYIYNMPGDPFRERSYHYGYIPVSDSSDIWILRSDGPDRDADFDMLELADHVASTTPMRWTNEHLFKIYNPSNGIESSGDIIRTGP
jgi:hypothetical protein